MANATISKINFLKDASGNFIYDERAIAKFHAGQVRAAKRQNAKVSASPKLQRSYSIIDPVAFADLQVNIYKHNFRQTTAVTL